MALVKPGAGITDIRGGFGGVYFTRDRSGLHSSAKPRRVHQLTAAQRKQRNAFNAARRYSKDNRTVSYLMYRYINGLPIALPFAWTLPLSFSDPDSRWDDELLAYDEDPATRAENPNIPVLSWGNFLELLYPPSLTVRKIHFYVALPISDEITLIDIDLFYFGSWHHLYEGTFVRDSWIEKSLSPQRIITNARIRFWNDHGVSTRSGRLYEFAFFGQPVPGHVPVPTDYQIPKL